jgi:hypothetical protein
MLYEYLLKQVEDIVPYPECYRVGRHRLLRDQDHRVAGELEGENPVNTTPHQIVHGG